MLLLLTLRVEERIGQQELLRSDLVGGAYLVSIEGLRPEAELRELVLEADKLVEKVGPDFEVWTAEVHELKRLVEGSSESI